MNLVGWVSAVFWRETHRDASRVVGFGANNAPHPPYAVLLLALSLVGCSWGSRSGGYYEDDGPMDVAFDPDSVSDAVPSPEAPSRGGNPKSYEVFGKTYYVMNTAAGYRERGRASWYGKKFHGQKTSNGETYDMFAMTAAHKTLPLPSYVRVTHAGNGRSVVVRVNDRGPFHEGRIIDLSYAAAAKLQMLGTGSAPVEVEAILPGAAPVQEARAAPAPETPSTALAYLEVGVYDDPINAIALREELAALGLTRVEIRSSEQDEGGRHRVLVGPFPDSASLEQARSRLEESQIPSLPVEQ